MHSSNTACGIVFTWCLNALLLLPLSISAQENTLQVQFQLEPSRNTLVGAFKVNGVLYVSLNDLADVLRLTSDENEAAKRFEVSNSLGRLTCAANNAYVVVADSAGTQQVQQLPHKILYAARAYFVPLVSFLPYLSRASGASIRFDQQAGLLRVGGPFSPKPVFDLPTVVLEPKMNGMLIRLPATKPIRDIESWVREDWLYVTVVGAKVNLPAINAVPASGIVKKIVAIQARASVQLTFKLVAPVVAHEVIRDPNSNDVMIALRTESPEVRLPEKPKNDGSEKRTADLSQKRKTELPEKTKNGVQESIDHHRKRWELDVIVIDPGHGGRDVGAIGVSRVYEKEITLAIALKLGRLIEKRLPGVKVVYTRKTDTFVELHRRGQLANEADGKLFISVHCNSMPRKPSPQTGFEVYLLRPGRTTEAIEIAERENSVIELEEGYEDRYKKLTDENFILVTMAQSAHVKHSELFADLVQQEMDKHLTIQNRGVKQAGFYVLVGASMPNVLVETAYLSNKKDEQFLRSESGQTRIAESLFSAVRRYKTEYERFFTEGKEIGERQ